MQQVEQWSVFCHVMGEWRVVEGVWRYWSNTEKIRTVGNGGSRQVIHRQQKRQVKMMMPCHWRSET